MVKRARFLLVVLALMFTFGYVLVAGDTCRMTSTFTIPAALELYTDTKQPTLRLEAACGGQVQAKLALRVGTNDWPLDLHLGLVSGAGGEPAFNLFYQFVRGDQLGPAWISLPLFFHTNPVDQLPYPAWTDYTLAIRVNVPENTTQGTYSYKVRLLLRSRSGLTESVDLPVQVVVH